MTQTTWNEQEMMAETRNCIFWDDVFPALDVYLQVKKQFVMMSYNNRKWKSFLFYFLLVMKHSGHLKNCVSSNLFFFFFLSKFAASNRNRDISLCLVLDKRKMAEQTFGQIGIYSVFKILQTANNEEKPGRYKTQVTGNRPLFYQYGKYPKHLWKLTLGLIRSKQKFLGLRLTFMNA